MKLKEIYTGNIAVVIVILLFHYWTKIPSLFWIAVGILVLTLSSEKVARLFAVAVQAIFKFVGNINAKIILTIFYFLILTPIATLKRILSRNGNANSNWIEMKNEYNFKDMW